MFIRYMLLIGMAMGTQWTGAIGSIPIPAFVKNVSTRARTLVGNNLSALLHTLWALQCPYPYLLPAF